MRNYRFRSLIVAGLFALGSAQMAAAQSVILVFDSARIAQDSLAAKDLKTKLTTIGSLVNGELTTKSKAIEAEDKALQAILGPLNEQARAQRISTDLKARVEALQKNAADIQKLQERRRAEVEITQRCAEGEFGRLLRPVIEEINKARSATILIDRANLAFAADASDVTAEMIQKLDARVKTVNVSKFNLPDPVPEGYKPSCS